MSQGFITLAPTNTPATSEKRKVRSKGAGKSYDVTVVAAQLPRAPYHVYSVYHADRLVLRLLSNPGQHDIVDAIESKTPHPSTVM